MIAEFVQATASIPLYQMPAHLASFPKLWPFPRGDTYHWIPVLNRFDRILELFNKEYGLVDGPQTEPFRRRLLLKGDAEEGEAPQEQATDDILDKLHMDADADRVLIEQIVDFTRLLIENCGNRALYASSAHLEKLLNSTSTSLIRATLRLTLRLAQRYHAARMRTAHTTLHPALLQNHYDISLDKVKELAAPLPRGPTTAAPLFATPAGKGKDKAYGDRRGDSEKVNSSDLISLFALSETTLKQEFGGVSISYYDPSASSEEGTAPHASSESPATPTPARRTLNLQPHQTPRQPHPLANADSPATPVTPAFGGDGEGGRASGPKTFELSSEAVSTTDLYDLFRQGSNVLPQGPKSDFFNRLRSAKALHQGRSGLEDLVAIRLLAIANLGYVLGEKDFHTKIGQPDSDEPRRLQLAYQLAELVHPPGSGTTGVSQDLQTVALGTLEALARHKSKAPDVCAALSVNVNHGVLFYVVRKAVAELGKPEKNEDESEEDWREALYSLLNTLPTSQARAGEGMVSAGLLEILIEVLTLRTPQAERSYPKILNFLDTFVYNLRDAFSSIVSAKGLEILADLTSHEVDTSKKLAEEGKGMPAEYKTHYTDYKIPFYNQQNLRWLFKFLNHMLSHNSGGATDRLMRNLIDSPQLLGALKTVLLNPVVFGSTVWSLAVNILTSFIHNEPTSYQVIAEAGLSEAFLETVAQQPVGEQTKATDDTPKAPLETGILPHADAISTLPTAFGAICLAEAGMKLFKSSPALARFFEIFESPAHVKALDVDSDIANLIGSNVDELVRHHPPLKDDVMTCISNMIQRVVLLCSNKAAKDGVGAKLWTESEDGTMFVAGGRQALSGPGVTGRKETHATAGENKEDIEMADADAPAPNASSDSTVTLSEVVETEDSADGPTTAQYIRTVFRFLHGFFGHQHNCSAFIDAVGIESILDLGTLPCLSPHLAKPNEARGTSEDFGRVVQQLVEEKPHIATPAIVKRAQENLDRLEPLMRHTRKTAFFAPFTSFSPSEMQNSSEHRETLQRGTDYVKSLVNVHTLVQSLTVTFQGSMYNHRASNSITAQVNLADMYARLVHSLGLLNRSCVWEEILLQKNMPAEWEKETRISRSQLESVAESFGIDIMADNEPAAPAEPTDVSVVDGPDAATSNQNTSSNQESAAVSLKSARFKNTRTLRYLLSKVPTTIAPFFHALGKLLLFRRSLEPYQKQCAILVADQLAQAAIDQFEFEGPRESDLVQEKYAYWILSLDSMSQLMVDSHSLDRVTHALTLILVSFRNLGGLTVLADVLSSFYESAVAVVKTPRDDMKQDTRRLLNLALGGIRSVLDFYVHIITSKVINESAQTTTLQSRPDRGRESADYFLAAQFVVELRHAVIKPVQKIWNSELMDNATTSIVKTSISILKTVLDGDTEFGAYQRLDQIPKRNKPTIKPWKPRSGDYIQRLKDLGFDEGLAKEALYRCCDNFNAAREYCENQNRIASRNPPPSYENELKTTPTAEAETGDNATDDASDAGSDESHNSDGSDGEDDPLADMEGTDDAPENVDTGTQSPVADVTDPNDASWDLLAYRRRMRVGNLAEPVALDELDKERAALRTNLIDRSLDILNSHDDVTFELADLILAAVAKASDSATMRADIGSTLVQSLISLETGDDFREHGKKIAASAHLLALVIQDKDFYEAVVGELQDSFMMLLEFIKIFPDHPPEQSSPWVGQVLVIVERLLAEDQLPAQIEWTPPTGDEEAVSVEDMPTPVVPLDEKMQLLEAILDVLPRIGKDESLALSVTRVLVMLTRVREIAAELAKKRNIQRLFLMIRQLSGITNDGLRSAFMIVLRHIIEDETIIRQIMRTDIQTMFEQRERRQTDTTAYTRQMHYLAIRDPRIFVEVTNEKLQLARFDANQRPQNLILKKEELDTPASEDTASSGATDEKPKDSTELRKAPPLERTKTSELKPPVVENPDGVIHYLLCELLAYKEVEDNAEISKTVENANLTAKEDTSSTTPEAPSDQTIPASDLAKPEKVEFKAEAHPIYIYRCFILKCLAELLQSYNRTKVEFINFSRKADPHASTPSKPRSGVLNYLLSALVPVGTLSHEGDLTFKKKSATSSCAIDVIVSLCAKTGEHKQPPGQASPYTESEPDLLFVRKFVLEHALKAFKDASVSDEALDMKYSRLLSISDIFSKMVSQRSDGQMLSPTAELTPPLKQMAKIMYEKNFITVLTTAIADIDLNFPNAKRAVKYILKPLKWLSTVAVDLSTHYDTSASPGSMDEYEISSASDDDMVGATREETPDLFRNSTLGMYEPPHESDDEDEDEEGDEEMYDEVFGDEMEYEEDMDDEDVVSDEDEEMGDMGPIEGLPGDVDVEVVIDDDDDEPISGEDDDSEEDEDEDDDEDDEEEDDEDDDMDDMDDMDEIDEMEEITGDDENASLVDDGEGSWSGDNGFIGGDIDLARGNIPPGLVFGLEQPQQMHDAIALRNMDDLDDYMEEEEGLYSYNSLEHATANVLQKKKTKRKITTRKRLYTTLAMMTMMMAWTWAGIGMAHHPLGCASDTLDSVLGCFPGALEIV
jgi:E3 ubiquitin-protein ligase HUWE1